MLAADFSRSGTDVYLDPGWDPHSYWGRSMGTRAVIGLGLATPWARAPKLPYSYAVPALQGRDTRLDHGSLIFLRLLATLCAVTGASLLAWRLGWVGTFAVCGVPEGHGVRLWVEEGGLLRMTAEASFG